MLIRELEERTGLERATIRFYEKEGLITPHREENGYRSYSDSNRQMLLKIKLLRQLGMPLEKIKALQQGSADFSEALAFQILMLEKQISDSRRAKEVCIDIRSAGTSFGELDAEYYLNELANPKRDERKWIPQPVPEFYGTTPVHPWRRYLARAVDLVILEMVILFITVVILRVRPMNHFIYTVIGLQFVMYLLWIPIEGLLLHHWGTTPGKWIFGIRVESANGGLLSISDAMQRAADIFLYGYGLTIPFIIYWRQYVSYKQYTEQGFVQWDIDRDAEVQFDYHYSAGKSLGIVCIIIAYIITAGVYAADSIKPKHRGEDLTVAQIAENYNDFLDQLYEKDVSKSMYLLEDGTWKNEETAYGTTAVVFVEGEPVGGFNNYQYELENGFVRSITYEQTWTDVFHKAPVGSRVICTIKAIAFGQDWLTVINGSSIEVALNDALEEPSGEFKYENLEIRWMTETENCKFLNSGGYSYYYTDNDDLPSSMTLKIKIMIHDIP